MQADIDSIVYCFIPDKREAVCDLNLEMKDGKLFVRGETNILDVKTGIVKYFDQKNIEYLDSLKILPDISEVSKPWGIIKVCVANMKQNASHSSELVSQAVMGTPLKILRKEGGWIQVQTPDHYIGWMTGSSVSMKDEPEFTEWKQSDRLIYTSVSGYIVSQEDGSDVISDAVAGVIVTKISATGNYYIVELPDGRRGRLNKNDVLEFGKWCEAITPEAGRLIDFAKSDRNFILVGRDINKNDRLQRICENSLFFRRYHPGKRCIPAVSVR